MFYIGVDPHKDMHVVAIVDAQAREVARHAFRANASGYAQLLSWAETHAPARSWGIENPNGYGRGLAQFLVAQGEAVRAVAPHLTGVYRRRSCARDKSDQHDALAVARALLQEGPKLPAVLAETATAELGVLVEHLDNLKAEATRARNRLHAQLLALDPDYQDHGPLTDIATVQQRARPGLGVAGARWQVVAVLCERLLALDVEQDQLLVQLKPC